MRFRPILAGSVVHINVKSVQVYGFSIPFNTERRVMENSLEFSQLSFWPHLWTSTGLGWDGRRNGERLSEALCVCVGGGGGGGVRANPSQSPSCTKYSGNALHGSKIVENRTSTSPPLLRPRKIWRISALSFHHQKQFQARFPTSHSHNGLLYLLSCLSLTCEGHDSHSQLLSSSSSSSRRGEARLNP
jgi:hypothetical protein